MGVTQVTDDGRTPFASDSPRGDESADVGGSFNGQEVRSDAPEADTAPAPAGPPPQPTQHPAHPDSPGELWLALPPGVSDYERPPFLTPNGRIVFDNEVQAYARRLAREVERAGHVPGSQVQEFTAEIVGMAARTLRTEDMVTERARNGRRGEPAADPSASATVLVTLATVGLSIMPTFMSSPWQRVVFGAPVLTGLVGLWLTWSSSRKR
jgi:hypothetical protein